MNTPNPCIAYTRDETVARKSGYTPNRAPLSHCGVYYLRHNEYSS